MLGETFGVEASASNPERLDGSSAIPENVELVRCRVDSDG